jgi:hypothetical protein
MDASNFQAGPFAVLAAAGLTETKRPATEPFTAATDTVQVENERVSKVILTFYK